MISIRYSLYFTMLAVAMSAQTPDWRNIIERLGDSRRILRGPALCRKNRRWRVARGDHNGPGHEGAGGQHVISVRSTDRGKTWEKPVDVEPSNGPEASYAVLLKVPAGRVYVFYNHNTDNVRQVIGDNPPYKDGFVRRVDSLGHFVFKYSDDHGKSGPRDATRFRSAISKSTARTPIRAS